MGHVLRQERSSTQRQTLGAVIETKLPWTERSSLSQDKNKIGHSFGQPYLNPNCESRRTEGTEKVVRPKSSKDDLKSRIGHKQCDDDNELVKHMSNLPGFLQKVEMENSVQEKALNFGVLDWKRLEKWKYTERMPSKHPKKTSSTSNSSYSASGPPKIGPNLRNQPSSHGPLYSGEQPMPHGSRFSSPQRRPPPHSSYLYSSKEERKDASCQKEEKHAEHIKSKGKGTNDRKYHSAESISIGRQQDHFHQTVPSYDGIRSEANVYNCKRKDRKNELVSESKASSSEHGESKFCPVTSHDKTKAQGKKSETRSHEGKFTSECSSDPQDIVLLIPKDFPKASCSESSQFTESRTSVDGQLAEVTGNRVSNFFSPQELYSGEFPADIPHSCPLPSGALEPHNMVNSKAVELDTAMPSSLVEGSDKEQADIAEQPTVKGRAPSPTRRFSFNLGRLSRSHSFKESSPVPQLSSTYNAVKSGPVRPEASSGTDKCKRDQTNASSRGRSSPLRRLLDPLLKFKGAQSAESVKPPNRSLPSSMDSKIPSIGRKPEGSTFQALLQLTLKNGIPFFKFVVDNSNEMLAAAVKRLPSPGKGDPCMIYSFYSVHEIKKKSMNWINQGSKSKDCNLGYNIVGHMKISNSYYPKANAMDLSDCDARECVLFGADPGSADNKTLEFVPNKEIVAIIVKNMSKKMNQYFKENDLGQCASAVMFDTEENKNSNGTVVVLPGGVHGAPVKGAPSSLISRWRSGGSCDCGGWDVGCKLRVLTDNIKSSSILQGSTSSSNIDHVNLFEQVHCNASSFEFTPY